MTTRTLIRLVIASCAAAFAVLGVTAIASETTLLAMDRWVQDAVIASRAEWLNRAMVGLTFLGTRYAIGAFAAVLAMWSLITGKQRALVAVIVAAVVLNPLVEVGFKELVNRVRPNSAQLLPGNGPSFPSGHVLASAGFYGMLPFLVWDSIKQGWEKVCAVAVPTAVIIIVAVSRVYLDVHWTTDVLAGLLLGTVLVAITWQAHRPLRRRWEPIGALAQP